MQIRVLGPLEVSRDTGPTPVGTPRSRALLTLLAARAGRTVSTDELVEMLWPPGSPLPPTARNTVQVYVSALRKALAGTPVELTTEPGGYRLNAPAGAVDVQRFEALAASGAAALRRGQPHEARAALDEALRLWRGPPFADLPDRAVLAGDTARLEELRFDMVRLRAEALLAGGDPGAAVAELEAAVAAFPLREVLWALLMRALYACGRQADALRAYGRARDSLAELGVEPGPELRRTHLGVLRQELAPTAPAQAPTQAPAPAPARAALVGRAAETRAVAELLRTNRVVTLAGPGGIGKTRLALAVAEPAAGPAAEPAAGPNGTTHFVPLASVTDDRLILAAVADALALRPGTRTAFAAVVAELAERDALLTLDNAEHLPGAAAEVARLVDALPRLRVLVTSRAPLHIATEHVFHVPPLALPPVDAEPDAIAGYAAPALFVARARAAGADLALDGPMWTAVAGICRALDGLPLAIELAAVRARMMAPATLLDRLQPRLPLLTGGPKDAPVRHRTLHNAIEWSHQLLDADEQRLLRRLSVFAGGATLDAVQAVCGNGRDPFDALAGLVDKSLVRAVHTPDGRTRYTMLETVREYAAERLRHSGEAAAVGGRLTGEVVALADRVRTGTGDVWSTVDTELANVRAVLASADRAGDHTSVARIVTGLFSYWLSRGLHREERRWLDALLPRRPDLSPELAARVTANAAWLAIEYGEMDAATVLARDGIRRFHALGRRVEIGRPLSALAAASYFTGRYHRAQRLLGFAADLAAAEGDRATLTRALANRGMVALAGGDLAAAREFFEQAGQCCDDDLFRTGKVDCDLALVALEAGDRGAARTQLDTVVRRLRELADRGWLPIALSRLARTVVADEPAAAGAMLAEALRLAVDGGIGRLTPPTIALGLAEVAECQGDPDSARRLLGAVDALVGGLCLPGFDAGRYTGLAERLGHRGPVAATGSAERALAVAAAEAERLGRLSAVPG